ncbi:MAG: hypothetical protein LBR81_06280 [Prevotellaceae bacterium]|jgi:hypothetical protein|nr:hypothetical protein [Prevotellaceae bacterium]
MSDFGFIVGDIVKINDKEMTIVEVEISDNIFTKERNPTGWLYCSYYEYGNDIPFHGKYKCEEAKLIHRFQ